MKLVTSAQNLKSGLRLFRGLIQKHMNIPVVRCVQISGDTLSGTDLDNDLSVRIAVKEADGDMLVDYSQLLEIVSLIPSNEDVTLTQSEDRKAVLSFGSAQYNLLAARPGDYHPAITIPTVKPKIFRCGNAGLAAAFKRVSHAISTEETRYWYYLNGACLTKDKDGNPYVVATDGHRLAAKAVPAAKHFDGQIVQRRAIDFVLRFGEPTEVHFWPDSNVARFELPGATLVTKLIDGSFPDWTRVIPDQGDTQMTLNASRQGCPEAAGRWAGKSRLCRVFLSGRQSHRCSHMRRWRPVRDDLGSQLFRWRGWSAGSQPQYQARVRPARAGRSGRRRVLHLVRHLSRHIEDG